MKTVLKVSAIVLISMFLNACGGGGGSTSGNNDNQGTNERMERGKVYKINKGDEIEKLSDDPKIEVTSNLKTGETEVKLISGEAALIRY